MSRCLTALLGTSFDNNNNNNEEEENLTRRRWSLSVELSTMKLQPACFAGHVQIAQVPGRNEPDSAGELNYRYLLDTLESCGYQGYVGCEYKPQGECWCVWTGF